MSFSAEMKAFINAYSAGQKINASRTDQEYKDAKRLETEATTKRENDPETLALAKRTAEARLASAHQSMKNAGAASGRAERLLKDRLETSALRRRVLESQLTPPKTGIGLAEDGVLSLPPATLSTEPALPVEQDPFPPGSEYNPDPDPVANYAEGGLVEDAEEDDEEGVLDVAPTPAAAPTDVSAQSRRTPTQPIQGLNGVISPALAADAVKAGMTFGIRESGLANPGAIRTPRSQAAARAIAAGQGGLSEEEMAAAKKAVDPEGKYTESQRNMAALGSVYQFYANKGEPQKAEKVAFQMLQYYRNASQRYAAIAAKAAEGGNIDLATKAALKAYQNIPDGNDIQLETTPDGRINYILTGPNGESIRKGVATPQQLAASAMGMATGGFDKAILAAAGAREAQAGGGRGAGAVGGGGGKPPSATDRAKVADTIGGEVEKMKTEWQTANKDVPVREQEWSELGNIAQRIFQQNPDATPNEAALAAHALLKPTAKGEKPSFKLNVGEDGVNTLDFGKMKVTLDDNQLDAIMNSRAARVKADADKTAAAEAEAKKPGFMDKAGAALSTAGGLIAKDAEKFAGEVKGAIGDETIARTGSAINAGKRLATDILTQLTKPRESAADTYKQGVRDAAEYVGKLLGGRAAQAGEPVLDVEDRPL